MLKFAGTEQVAGGVKQFVHDVQHECGKPEPCRISFSNCAVPSLALCRRGQCVYKYLMIFIDERKCCTN